ncbi:MAG TPA: Rieske 2Fe-2S domain-containing protein [Thermoanaerobaculia bacterium]|nr:Rieske 2Fe-2S domain-containing protein [Thermoanaerobaculia bacterium]
MDDYEEIARLDDLTSGRPLAVDVGGRRVVLYRTADGVFATDNVCPHRGGPLAEGDLIGNEIICPWHLWGFDVRTGICTGNDEVMVAHHDVKVVDGRVFIRLAPLSHPLAEELG